MNLDDVPTRRAPETPVLGWPLVIVRLLVEAWWRESGTWLTLRHGRSCRWLPVVDETGERRRFRRHRTLA